MWKRGNQLGGGSERREGIASRPTLMFPYIQHTRYSPHFSSPLSTTALFPARLNGPYDSVIASSRHPQYRIFPQKSTGPNERMAHPEMGQVYAGSENSKTLAQTHTSTLSVIASHSLIAYSARISPAIAHSPSITLPSAQLSFLLAHPRSSAPDSTATYPRFHMHHTRHKRVGSGPFHLSGRHQMGGLSERRNTMEGH